MKRKAKAALAATHGRCWYCGKFLEMPRSASSGQICSNWFVLDHVVPRSKGGSDDPSNLVASCWLCNSGKGNKTVEEYRYHLAKREAGQIYFSPAQIEWLARHGFEMPPRHVYLFWAEENISTMAVAA